MKTVLFWADWYLNHWFGRCLSRKFCLYADFVSARHFIAEQRNPTPGHSCRHCQEWTGPES